MIRLRAARTHAAHERARWHAWLVALGAIATLAGCGGTTAAKGARRASSAPQLHIGDSATVSGSHSGEKIQVTLLAFMPDVPGEANDHPEFDMQYVGAQLKLTNVGSTSYSGAPSEDVVVYTNEDQKSRKAVLREGACSDGFAREVQIAPRRSQQGCVPAQIPVVASATKLRFVPGGGFAAAEWSLAKPRKAAG